MTLWASPSAHLTRSRWRDYFPVLTHTSKQADKARSSNHFRNKDKQFNPYYIIHWIQLISSKVTPESKIVLALHFIYSYEGITGNQDSLLRALLRTPVTRALYTWKHHLNHDQSFTINFFLIYEKKLFHSDYIITFTIFLLPDIKTWVSCIEQWLFFLILSPLSASTFENLHTPCCKHFKIFQRVLCGFSPFNTGMTDLSEANYILHNIAFVIFHVISLEQAMKVWCGNVLLEKKIRRNTPFWTSGTKIIKILTQFFPVTGMEGDLNADTGTSNWKHQCLHA